MTSFNPWLGFLEEEPKAAYFSYGDQFGGPRGSQRQRGFFQNQFSDIYNKYLGSLGVQARQGAAPTGSFNDYLGGFDFNDWYRQSVPYESRNQGFSSFAPPTRWLNPSFEQR